MPDPPAALEPGSGSEPPAQWTGAIAVAAAAAALLIPVIDFAVVLLSGSRIVGAKIATFGAVLGSALAVVALLLGFASGLDRQRPHERSRGCLAIYLALIALPINLAIAWLADLASTPLN